VCETCANRPVAGEKVVTPSAIVQLTFKCRYIYPSTPATKKSLPNGHLIEAPNGHAETTEGEETQNSSDEKRDIKDVIEDVTDVVVDKAEKMVGQKGKEAIAKPEYAPNGYAHAPHWPLVSLFLALLSEANGSATETSLLRLVG
jgi:translocation protein SEC63